MLAVHDDGLRAKMADFQADLKQQAQAKGERLRRKLAEGSSFGFGAR